MSKDFPSKITPHIEAFLQKYQADSQDKPRAPRWTKQRRFPSNTSYEKFSKLPTQKQDEYADSAHLTITAEEFAQAQKYIALVMIAQGQHQKDGKSQAEIYASAGISPDLTDFAHDLSILKSADLDSPEGKKSLKDLIDQIAEKVSPQNVKSLYQRLYSKRPLTFWNSYDQSLSQDLQFKADGSLHSDTNLAENICYSEIELAALMQVSSRTIFINNGNKNNNGITGAERSYVEEGIVAGLVGARIGEISDGMEAHHLKSKALEKSLAAFVPDAEKLGNLGRIKRVNKAFVAGYRQIWGEFYRTPEKEAEFEKYDAGKIDAEGLTKRLYLSYKKFIYDNIAQAEKLGKKAYIRLSGLGDGVWASEDIKPEVKLCIGKAIAQVYSELGSKMAEHVAAFEICEFVRQEDRNAVNRYTDNFTYAEGFKSYILKDHKTLSPSIPVIVSSNKDYVEPASPFTKKDIADQRLIAGNLPDDFDQSKKYLCIAYAYDGGSYPGNEYWEGSLSASTDPAIACATGNVFLQNALTNPELLERVEVVKEKGEIVRIEDYTKEGQKSAGDAKKIAATATTITVTATPTAKTTTAATRAPAVNPRAYEIALAPGETRAAQAEFRNALACIAQANPYQRAILRDRLATASCPPDILRDLQMGLVQLDTTDFLNFLLDEVMPDVNKVDVVSTVTSLDGDTEHSAKSEKQTKLELNFPGTGNGNASITTMLQNYQAGEFLYGANKYKHNGRLVDAIKKLTPKVTNSDAELVVSIKRFDYRYDGTTKQIVRKKIETPITLDQVALPCGDEQKQYLPTAFIVHLGSTMRGGHYVAYVKEQKDDGSQVWVEYNDSARTELTADLPEEAQDAYVVKYSPVNERGVCKLPKSQSHGTSNGGNRCWANAAFAFAMSMVSLDKREVAVGNAAAAAPAHYYMPPQDQPRAVPTALSSGSGSDNDFVDAFLALEEESSNSKSPGDHLAFLKRVATLFARKEKDELSNLGEQIAEMGFRSPDVLLGEAVGSYFTAIATDNNTESLTDLHGFFSDPANSKLVSGIIGEIVKNEDEFKKDPEQFVAEKITSETPLTRPASQRRGAKTIIELCCDAAEKGDVATFERYLERIKTNPKFEITLRELILPVANDLPEEKRDEKQRIVALINSLLPEKQQRGNQSTPPEEIPDSDDEEGENLQALLASMAAEAEAERKRKEAEALLQLQRQKDGAEALARAQAAALAAEAERIKEERVAALAAEAAKREKEAEEEAKRDWTILEGNQYKLKLETPTSTSPLEPTAILLAKESKFMSVKTVESTAFKDSLRGSSMRLAQGATTDKNELIKLLAAVVISSIRETLLVKNYDSQDILIEDRIQAAMDYAKSNGGFSSKVKDKKDKGKTEYADIEETTAPRFFLEFWKEVSGKIQQKNLELGILTGRLDEDKPNDDFVVIPVGLRSTFVFDILSSPEALAVLNGTTGIAVGTASRTMAELLSKSSASGAEVDGIKQMISTAKSAVKTANNPDTGASR